IKWYVAEEHQAPAMAIRDRYRAGEFELLVPDLFYAEIGNVLWKKRLSQGLDLADAGRIVDAVLTLPLDVTSSAQLLTEAYRLADEHGRTVYDSLYLALALSAGCPFITADRRLVSFWCEMGDRR
ncbi:MAG: type II toxin-antitoxin system VapC family toxin, partial [Gemmatimonadota bacterium]|nr:type II toxin-antitoxin system VapC family toxin [Gemmatimonadota bacterium]